MTGEMIYAVGNEHVLVNVKGRCDALRKDVGNVVIGVRTIVELGAEGALPFLGRDLAECIWSMKQESFELQFANALNARSNLKCQVPVGFVGIRSLDEAYLRVEVWTRLSALHQTLQPVRTIGQRSPHIARPTKTVWGPSASHVSIHEPVFEKDQACVGAARLIRHAQNVS